MRLELSRRHDVPVRLSESLDVCRGFFLEPVTTLGLILVRPSFSDSNQSDRGAGGLHRMSHDYLNGAQYNIVEGVLPRLHEQVKWVLARAEPVRTVRRGSVSHCSSVRATMCWRERRLHHLYLGSGLFDLEHVNV